MIHYRGANLETILMWLNKHCEAVRLEARGLNEWCLYCFSEEHGEFEETGPLPVVLIHAFKPFEDEFAEWAERTKNAFVGMLRVLVDHAKDGGAKGDE